MARQPRVRHVRQRGPAERRGEADDRRLGRRRRPRGRPARPARAGPLRRGLAHPRPRPGHRLAQDRQDPRRGDDALPELRGRPQAQEGRLGAGVAGAAGEPVGGPSPGRLRAPAGEPRRRVEDRLPGGLRARDAAPHPARGGGPARPGRLAADVPGPLHPARHRRRPIAARSAWSSPTPRRSARR